MKLQPLYDLQEELNRIYIAGSKLSAGDPRLQKHIPTFNKLGEKVPVFAKIASGLDELLKADKETSSEKLTSVSTLLYSVLYTQGETIEEGCAISEQVPTIDIKDLNTNSSYLEIKPIIEALTTTGSGRYEIVLDAFNRKVLTDSRLYHYIDAALGDKYSELSNLIEKTVVPAIGVEIMPVLLHNFKIEDTKIQERRFGAILAIGFDGADELCHQILQSSCNDLQVIAIEYLGNNPKNEDLLISMLGEKSNAKLRAVCIALGIIDSETSVTALVEAYLKNKTKTKVEAYSAGLAKSSSTLFFKELFEKAKNAYTELDDVDLKDEKQVKSADVKSFSHYLTSISNSKQPEALVFYKEVLGNKQLYDLVSKKGFYSYEEPICKPIINIVRQYPIVTQLEFLSSTIQDLKKIYNISNTWLGDRLKELSRRYLEVSVESGFTKEQVYDIFSEAYIKGDLYIRNIVFLFYEQEYGYQETPDTLVKSRIDPRWVNLFLKQLNQKDNGDEPHLLHFLSNYDPASPQLIEFLNKRINKLKVSDPSFSTIGKSILSVGNPEMSDKLMKQMVDDIIKGGLRYFPHYTMWYMIAKIPRTYADQFITLSEKYSDKPCASLLTQIADKILRNN